MLAYTKWADKVPSTSLVLLVYMAIVARDDDDTPWYSEGHEALAEKALGRSTARKDIAAVERAISPLLASGAIVSDRRAAPRREGGRTVRYRLNLGLTPHGNHGTNLEVWPVDIPNAEPVDSSKRPTVSVGRTSHGNRANVPRFPEQRPTETV